jgi:hypothetical protein
MDNLRSLPPLPNGKANYMAFTMLCRTSKKLLYKAGIPMM